LPFGSGPRMCIGNNFAILELKATAISKLKNMEMKFLSEKFPGYDCSLMLRPKNDMKVVAM